MTDLGDTLVQNNLAYAVFGPLTAEASFIYRWFREPAARSGYPAESRALVADLRAAVTPAVMRPPGRWSHACLARVPSSPRSGRCTTSP